ncbi:deoxyguanosinetriphosphate triphosphohydrolase [Clostridium botulinum]|uniref:deoxyguanosinetriphosphate triphosphohydrolase n=1 Tax=Clostridium botulinum TaxID=1491 RepID=UPI0007732164|nr:deoxyguanosinetriphosphate triphosphohydrolase [Clostridium botulinum]
MNWYDLEGRGLLNCNTEVKRSERKETDARSPFDSDYDRIIFSAPFRRLQDKAQVFPLEKSDFVRTRLTHSLEVATIARSIGISVEKELIQNGYLNDNYSKGDIPVILKCAGLAHDLGNPPFGHYGEETIKKVFEKIFDNNQNVLTKEQKNDFLHFDGNCQTIRILTRLQCLNDKYGFHLTYATLATLMKYPMNSVNGNKKNGKVSYKKFGYFQSEKEVADKILSSVGTKIEEGQAFRHPLAFLLEAADDIAYSAADLEDGFKKKVITIDDIKEMFKDNSEILDKLEEFIANNEYYVDERVIQRFRIYLQGRMIDAVIKTFIENQEKLLSGDFDKEILLESSEHKIREMLKELADKKILCNEEIYKTELSGEIVIEYLLNFFINVLSKKEFVNKILESNGIFKNIEFEGKEKRVYNLISIDFRIVYEKRIIEIINNVKDKNIKYREVLYNTYLLITDYISCMTDNYSVDLYRRLKGITIN